MAPRPAVPPPVVVPAPALADLAAVVLRRVQLPLREPFVAAHGTETVREVVIIEAVGVDGTSGWGECSALSRPTYSPEYTDGAWRRLRDDLVPGVLAGRPVQVADCPLAWTGLAGALTDLHLRRVGRSLAASIGGARREVPCTAVVGRQGGIDALLARVAQHEADGYRSVKLKVAPGPDVDAVARVRAAFPDLALAVDANGSFVPSDPAHRDGLARLDGLGLSYLEQPTGAGDPAALRALAAGLATPIALDESITSAADVTAFAATGASFVLNAKPARLGGLDPALVAVAAAASAGWPVFVGGLLETGVGRALALAAASWEACTLPTDLGPSSRYFAADLTEPIELLPGGRLPVPTGPGLGVSPDADRLAAATVARATCPVAA